MNTRPHRCRDAVLVAVVLVAVAASGATAVAAPAARYTLRGAQLDALPRTQEHGRFRLRARAEPPTVPPAQADAGPLHLTATLTPKALVAQCPLPGSIFFDGFDAP